MTFAPYMWQYQSYFFREEDCFKHWQRGRNIHPLSQWETIEGKTQRQPMPQKQRLWDRFKLQLRRILCRTILVEPVPECAVWPTAEGLNCDRSVRTFTFEKIEHCASPRPLDTFILFFWVWLLALRYDL